MLNLLELTMSLGLAAFPEIHQKWITASFRISGRASHLVMHVQQDGRLDMLLRKIEEGISADRSILEKASWGTDLVGMFSRHWVLSMYENLRTHCDFASRAESGEKVKKQDWTPALDRAHKLRDRFALVRIPLAKLEIQGANKHDAPEIQTITFPPKDGETPEIYKGLITPYFPVQGIDFTNGSAFWDVIDIYKGEQIRLSRRRLSDEVLELFAPSSEQQK